MTQNEARQRALALTSRRVQAACRFCSALPLLTRLALLRLIALCCRSAAPLALQVILSFTSNWTPMGGVDQFANLTGGSHNDFFSKETPKALFKDFIRCVHRTC